LKIQLFLYPEVIIDRKARKDWRKESEKKEWERRGASSLGKDPLSESLPSHGNNLLPWNYVGGLGTTDSTWPPKMGPPHKRRCREKLWEEGWFELVRLWSPIVGGNRTNICMTKLVLCQIKYLDMKTLKKKKTRGRWIIKKRDEVLNAWCVGNQHWVVRVGEGTGVYTNEIENSKRRVQGQKFEIFYP